MLGKIGKEVGVTHAGKREAPAILGTQVIDGRKGRGAVLRFNVIYKDVTFVLIWAFGQRIDHLLADRCRLSIRHFRQSGGKELHVLDLWLFPWRIAQYAVKATLRHHLNKSKRPMQHVVLSTHLCRMINHVLMPLLKALRVGDEQVNILGGRHQVLGRSGLFTQKGTEQQVTGLELDSVLKRLLVARMLLRLELFCMQGISCELIEISIAQVLQRLTQAIQTIKPSIKHILSKDLALLGVALLERCTDSLVTQAQRKLPLADRCLWLVGIARNA